MSKLLVMVPVVNFGHTDARDVRVTSSFSTAIIEDIETSSEIRAKEKSKVTIYLKQLPPKVTHLIMVKIDKEEKPAIDITWQGKDGE